MAKDGRIDRRGLCGSIAKVAMMMVILVVVYGTVAYVGFSLFRIGGWDDRPEGISELIAAALLGCASSRGMFAPLTLRQNNAPGVVFIDRESSDRYRVGIGPMLKMHGAGK